MSEIKTKVPESVEPEKEMTISELDAAILADEKNAKLYYQRGVKKAEAQLFGEGIDDLSKAIELKPDYVEAYSARGLERYYQGELDDALRDLTMVHRAAVATGGSDVATLFNLGLVYLDTPGKYKEAYHYLEKPMSKYRTLLTDYYKASDENAVERLKKKITDAIARLTDELAAKPNNFYIKQLLEFLEREQKKATAV